MKSSARQSVRTMVNLSRRLGAVIMPTNRLVAGLRDAAFALLNRRAASARLSAAAACCRPRSISKQRADGKRP